jgi:hypothetical protein
MNNNNKKEIVQEFDASIDLNCILCDKFMGSILVECEADWEERAKEVIDILVEKRTKAVCDICSATKGRIIPGTLRRKKVL